MTLSDSLTLVEDRMAKIEAMYNAIDKITGAFDQMASAIQNAADRMGALMTAAQKTADTSTDMRAPFDGLANGMQAAAQRGDGGLKAALKPKTMLISVGIGIAWALFGDDITTILEPAMGVLESFAGVVHSAIESLAPIFEPIVWIIGLLAMGLDEIAARMDTLMPAILGIASVLLILNFNAVIAAIKMKVLGLAALFTGGASAKAAGGTTLLTMAQSKLNLAMLASPMGILIMLFGALVAWIASVAMRTGSLKEALIEVGETIRGFFGAIGKFFGLGGETTNPAAAVAEENTKAMAEGVTVPEVPAIPDPSVYVANPDDTDWEAMLRDQNPMAGMEGFPQTDYPMAGLEGYPQMDYSMAGLEGYPQADYSMAGMEGYPQMDYLMADQAIMGSGITDTVNTVDMVTAVNMVERVSLVDMVNEVERLTAVERVTTVDTVTKLDSGITIDEESLGPMKLLAEREPNQITVNPSVTVHATVRETADIDNLAQTVAEKIGEMIADESSYAMELVHN